MSDNHREDYAKEALKEGRHAARSALGDNPHDPGTFEHRVWEQGHSGAAAAGKQQAQLDKITGPLNWEIALTQANSQSGVDDYLEKEE